MPAAQRPAPLVGQHNHKIPILTEIKPKMKTPRQGFGTCSQSSTCRATLDAAGAGAAAGAAAAGAAAAVTAEAADVGVVGACERASG